MHWSDQSMIKFQYLPLQLSDFPVFWVDCQVHAPNICWAVGSRGWMAKILSWIQHWFLILRAVEPHQLHIRHGCSKSSDWNSSLTHHDDHISKAKGHSELCKIYHLRQKYVVKWTKHYKHMSPYTSSCISQHCHVSFYYQSCGGMNDIVKSICYHLSIDAAVGP